MTFENLDRLSDHAGKPAMGVADELLPGREPGRVVEIAAQAADKLFDIAARL